MVRTFLEEDLFAIFHVIRSAINLLDRFFAFNAVSQEVRVLEASTTSRFLEARDGFN